MLFLDWNTLIVGKLSPWIDADSEIETERRNSEAVSSSLWAILLTCTFLWGHRGWWFFDLKVLWHEWTYLVKSLPSTPLNLSPCVNLSCAHHFFPRASLQALAQELNFSAYLGLPVFMIPVKGPHNANLARLLLNHIHTGHHTSNVRHTAIKKNKIKNSTCTCKLLLDSREVSQTDCWTNQITALVLCLISSGSVSHW